MSNTIFKAINSYKSIEGINPGIIEYLEKVLKPDTKRRIENSRIHLHILAIIFKQVFEEKQDDSDVDKLVNDKLNDSNFIIRLGQELDDVNM